MGIRKGSLNNMVLLALEKAVDGYVRLEDFMYNTHIYAGGYDRPLKKSSLSKALKRLREKELIDFADPSQLAFRITNLGKDVLGEDEFEESKWDGKLRIVIFDIPETKRKVRTALRRKLIEWNFKRWQDSVWVTKRDALDKLEALIKKLRIQEWVAVIESEKYSYEDTIWSDRIK